VPVLKQQKFPSDFSHLYKFNFLHSLSISTQSTVF